MKATEILSEISEPTNPAKPGSTEFNQSLKYLQDKIIKVPVTGSIDKYKEAIQAELENVAKYIKPTAFTTGDLKAKIDSIGAADLMPANKPALDAKLAQLANAATIAWYDGRKEQFLNKAAAGESSGSRAEQILMAMVGVKPTDTNFFPILLKNLSDPSGSLARKMKNILVSAGVKPAP
jgi:hypothetical protein